MLELLLAGRCHHMHEVFAHPEDVPTWRAAIRGDEPDWRTFPPNCVATLDWPAAAFWGELSDAHPDAVVVLSTRASARAPRDAGRPAPRVKAADGWEPLCTALGLPAPDEPFPHTNTRAEWNA